MVCRRRVQERPSTVVDVNVYRVARISRSTATADYMGKPRIVCTHFYPVCDS